MNIITVDFETYYSKDLGFKSHTTEAYIRHDDFHVIGLSVADGYEPARWFSGTHTEIAEWMEQFDWAHSLVLAHNTLFDGAILSWKFGIKPAGWLDTLCMARAIHGVDAGGSLKALAERLIEKETIDAEELKAIIEASSPSPMIVPGTSDAARRRPGDEPATGGAQAAEGS